MRVPSTSSTRPLPNLGWRMKSPLAKRVDMAKCKKDASGLPSTTDHSGSGSGGFAQASSSVPDWRPDPALRCLLRFIDMEIECPLGAANAVPARERHDGVCRCLDRQVPSALPVRVAGQRDTSLPAVADVRSAAPGAMKASPTPLVRPLQAGDAAAFR